MTTEQETLKLRFQMGQFEQHLLYLILCLQITLAVMACLAVFWVLHMTIGAYFSPNDPTLMYAGWMVYPLGAVVIVSILNLLYE